MPKKGGLVQFPDLRGELGKKKRGGGGLRAGDTLMHTKE